MPVFDASEVHELAGSMAAAPLKVMAAIVPVAHRAGNNMKAGLRRNASGHRNMPALPYFVSYDIEASTSQVSVDVGFDRRGAGNLAHIAVYGSGHSGPFVDIDTPLATEVPNFIKWVAKVGAEAL